MCEILIIVFLFETKFWTFHSWLFKSIILYVELGGHKEKIVVYKSFKLLNYNFFIANNILKFINTMIVTITRLHGSIFLKLK
jgi:hypothetical protein